MTDCPICRGEIKARQTTTVLEGYLVHEFCGVQFKLTFGWHWIAEFHKLIGH